MGRRGGVAQRLTEVGAEDHLVLGGRHSTSAMFPVALECKHLYSGSLIILYIPYFLIGS